MKVQQKRITKEVASGWREAQQKQNKERGYGACFWLEQNSDGYDCPNDGAGSHADVEQGETGRNYAALFL